MAANVRETSPKGHFGSLDGLRGLAAFAVVFFHVRDKEEISALTAALPSWLRGSLFEHGNLGVLSFFVVSGFVITHSLRRHLRFEGGTVDLAIFSGRRLARLTPPYYASIAFALVMAYLAAFVNGEPFAPGGAPASIGRSIAHLFYVQEVFGWSNYNDVYWTLFLELQFYLALALLFVAAHSLARRFPRLSQRGWLRGLVGVNAAAALLWPAGIIATDGRAVWFLSLWYSFLFGALIAMAWHGLFRFRWVGLFSAGLGVVTLHPSNRLYVATALATGLIIIAACWGGHLSHWLCQRPFAFLGRISYSLYLTHTPIIGAGLVVSSKLFAPTVAGQAFMLGFAVVACLAAATAFYYAVERPAAALSQSVRRRPAATDVAPSPATQAQPAPV